MYFSCYNELKGTITPGQIYRQVQEIHGLFTFHILEIDNLSKAGKFGWWKSECPVSFSGLHTTSYKYSSSGIRHRQTDTESNRHTNTFKRILCYIMHVQI